MSPLLEREMSGRGYIALLLVVLAGDAAIAAPRHGGHVRYVSSKRGFLDAGRAEGLAVGTTVSFVRGARAVGSCTIDQLGDHTASCPTTKLRVRDTFALPTVAQRAQPPEVVLPPTPTPAQLEAARGTLASTDVELVEFRAAPRSKLTQGLPLVSVSIGHDAYITVNGDQFQQSRLELALNGVSIRWAGFRAYAHITALLAEVRPAAQRFRPQEFAQVYVWETAFTSREVGRPYTISVGRIWPYHTPGLALIDGAQVGWRSRGGTAEVGVYGGTIPDAQKLYPSVDRWTAGAYYAHTLVGGKNAALRVLSTEARLGVRGAAGPGPQLELEWALMAAIARKVDLGAQIRASIGGGDWSRPAFDAARVNLGIRPTARLRIAASFRYLGPVRVDYDAFAAGFFASSHMYHGTLDVTYDPRPWISLMLQAGVDHDIASGSARQYLGPELSFPNLGRGHGSISVGYREELGWYAGRVVYLQGASTSSDRYRVVARLSYLEDRLAGGFTSLAQRELGLFAYAEGRIIRWLALRGSVLGRLELQLQEDAPRPAAGLTARLELIASY